MLQALSKKMKAGIKLFNFFALMFLMTGYI